MENQAVEKHLKCSHVYRKELASLVAPLFSKTKVQYFSFNRFFRDGKWAGLYTDPDPVAIALKNGLQPLFADENGIWIENGTYVHKDLKDLFKLDVNSKKVDAFFDQAGNPGGKRIVQNGLLITRKGALYDDSFYFSLYETPLNDRTYFHCQSKNLKKFCHYFLNKGKKLIEICEHDRISRSSSLDLNKDKFLQMFYQNGEVDSESDWIKVNKFSFPTEFGEVFLSRQELNCLRLIARGFSYKEVGEKLELKFKTVESYVQNLKNKLSVERKLELVRHYENFSSLDFFEVEA